MGTRCRKALVESVSALFHDDIARTADIFSAQFQPDVSSRASSSLVYLLLRLVSTKVASCHAAMYNSDELGSVLTWQDNLPDNVAGQLSPLSTQQSAAKGEARPFSI